MATTISEAAMGEGEKRMNYIVLKNIQVINANAVSGFTWGFPAVSHFLGFVHALSRKTQQSEYKLKLKGCVIICHDHQVNAYRDTPYEPYSFALTRNPLTKEGKTAPIVEEGRMSLNISLIIECEGLSHIEETQQAQRAYIKQLARQHKLAGGTITDIASCYIAKLNDDDPSALKKLFRPLLPGFVLQDRSQYLAQENQKDTETPLKNWLNFYALRHQYLPVETDTEKQGDEESQKFEWQQIKRQHPGYLVPVLIGYKKIAPTYAAGEVANVRDNQVPVSFVEAVHSIGEWASPGRIENISDALWQYHYQDPYYLCHSQTHIQSTLSDFDDDYTLD